MHLLRHAHATHTSCYAHPTQGRDVSEASLALLRERCPELLEHFAYADVFPSAGGGAEAMAAAFGVPFFGRVRGRPHAACRMPHAACRCRPCLRAPPTRLATLCPPQVPLDPEIVRACEAGTSYTAGMQLRGARSLLQPIVDKLIAATTEGEVGAPSPMNGS